MYDQQGNAGTKTSFALQNSKEERSVEFVPFGDSQKIKLTIGMIQKFLAKPTRNGAICTEGDAIKFMMLCRSRALNPFEGDAFIVGYDGANGPEFNLLTSHQAFLKRAEACAEFDGMESGVVIRDEETGIEQELAGDYFSPGQTVVGGWARVHRKDRKYPKFEKLRLATFNKGVSQWKTNPEGQITKCAEAGALRAYFPTKLGGLYIAEEMKPAQVTSVSPEFINIPERGTQPTPEPIEPTATVPHQELGAKPRRKKAEPTQQTQQTPVQDAEPVVATDEALTQGLESHEAPPAQGRTGGSNPPTGAIPHPQTTRADLIAAARVRLQELGLSEQELLAVMIRHEECPVGTATFAQLATPTLTAMLEPETWKILTTEASV